MSTFKPKTSQRVVARGTTFLTALAVHLKAHPPSGEYNGPKSFFTVRLAEPEQVIAYAASLSLSEGHQSQWVKRHIDHLTSSFAEACVVAQGATPAANGADASYDVQLYGERVDIKVSSYFLAEIQSKTAHELIRKLQDGRHDRSREEHQNKAFLLLARPPYTKNAFEAKANLAAVKAAATALVDDWHNLERVPLIHGKSWFGVLVAVDDQGNRVLLKPAQRAA
jgi:hypothetical protein